jgi:heme oxygenase
MLGMEQEHDLPCTAEDRQRIIDAATYRLEYVMHVVHELEKWTCEPKWRKEAAQALRWLVS